MLASLLTVAFAAPPPTVPERMVAICEQGRRGHRSGEPWMLSLPVTEAVGARVFRSVVWRGEEGWMVDRHRMQQPLSGAQLAVAGPAQGSAPEVLALLTELKKSNRVVGVLAKERLVQVGSDLENQAEVNELRERWRPLVFGDPAAGLGRLQATALASCDSARPSLAALLGSNECTQEAFLFLLELPIECDEVKLRAYVELVLAPIPTLSVLQVPSATAKQGQTWGAFLMNATASTPPKPMPMFHRPPPLARPK